MTLPTKTECITFFLPSLQGGGAERVIVELANAFHANGRHVELVVGDARGPYRDEVNPAIEVIDFGKGRILSCLIPFTRYLIKRKPIAVFSTMMHTNVIALLSRSISFSNARVIIREAVTTEKTNGRPISSGKSTLLKFATALYPKADSIVCVSQGVLNSLKRDLELADDIPLEVIYNPVISDRFVKKSEDPTPLLKFRRKDALLFIAVARLVESKDYPTLLNAFAITRESLDAQLLILGEGVERPRLERIIKELNLSEDVVLAGFEPNPFAYMRAADLFVHSSLYEGMPNSVIQALALNKRAVVTRTKDGPSELFLGVEGVKLVETGKPALFSQAILQMLALEQVDSPDTEWFEKFSSAGVVLKYENLIY